MNGKQEGATRNTLRQEPRIRPEAKFWFGPVQQSRSGLDLDPSLIGVVFHLAGKVGPSGVIRFRGNIASDTIDAAMAAAWWAKAAGVPMVDISTSEAYGSPDDANSEDTRLVFRQGTAGPGWSTPCPSWQRSRPCWE